MVFIILVVVLVDYMTTVGIVPWLLWHQDRSGSLTGLALHMSVSVFKS